MSRVAQAAALTLQQNVRLHQARMKLQARRVAKKEQDLAKAAAASFASISKNFSTTSSMSSSPRRRFLIVATVALAVSIMRNNVGKNTSKRRLSDVPILSTPTNKLSSSSSREKNSNASFISAKTFPSHDDDDIHVTEPDNAKIIGGILLEQFRLEHVKSNVMELM